jgi:hypothetical protein
VKYWTYRGDVAELVFLASQNLPKNAPHNLTAASLGEIGHDIHGLGGSKGPDAPADLQDEFFPERIRSLVTILDGNKSIDGLAGEFVRHANYSSLGDGMVLNQGSLNLSRGQTVTANVHNVINTAADPVEALVVSACTVTGELYPS